MIPESHPRFESLKTRELLMDGFRAGAVAGEGLMAHGRGEAFDYMLGERTTPMAESAIGAAAVSLMQAGHPVISVNGNLAALCPAGVVELARISGADIEVNLFYDSMERRRIISDILRRHGAPRVLGADEPLHNMKGLDSARRRVSVDGILAADTVMVSMEDGDRTAALRAAGKRVIAVDINPLSRTSRTADITIVDNIMRAMPALIIRCRDYAGNGELPEPEAFDNKKCLEESILLMRGGIGA